MKPSGNIYYVSVENIVYALTEKQYNEAQEMLESAGYGFDKDSEQFYDALDYIIKVGKKTFVLHNSYNY